MNIDFGRPFGMNPLESGEGAIEAAGVTSQDKPPMVDAFWIVLHALIPLDINPVAIRCFQRL